jgi:hypothetical protein
VQRARVLVAGLLTAALPAAYGCGGGDEPPTDAGEQNAATTTTALRNPPPAAGVADPLRGAAPGGRRLTISVTDTARGVPRYRAPRTAPAGLVEIRLRNDGGTPHKAQLWRIDGDHTVREALRVRRPQPDWLTTAGGVGLTQPDRTSRSLQRLRPGLYYVAGTGDRPGRVATFRVTESAREQPLPAAPARVDALDFRFEVAGLRSGRNTVLFRNTGAEPHHAFFVPMTAGADLGDVRTFFTSRSSVGRPPVEPERTRETVVIEGGDRQVTELELDAGRYAVVCFVRNRGGGPPHIEFGMLNELTVR